MLRKLRVLFTGLAVVFGLTFLSATPAQAASGTELWNAHNSTAFLLTKNYAGQNQWLQPGATNYGSGFTPVRYDTAYNWCTNLYDYNNGYRRIIQGYLTSGEWANIPYPGHKYVIAYYYCGP